MKWIVVNNGVDVHTADTEFKEVATFIDNKDAKLGAAAPEMLQALQYIYDNLSKFDNDQESHLKAVCFTAIKKATI